MLSKIIYAFSECKKIDDPVGQGRNTWHCPHCRSSIHDGKTTFCQRIILNSCCYYFENNQPILCF